MKKICTKHGRALILNADYTPMGVRSWHGSMKVIAKEAVDVIDFYPDDFIIGANGRKYPVPMIVRLQDYVKPNKKIKFCKKNVFIRDHLTCQYCRKKCKHYELTFDHVMPRSRWTKHRDKVTDWENIVSACHECNQKKADRTPEEAGMRLIRRPERPNAYGFIAGLTPWRRMQKEWIPYMPPHYKDMMKISGMNYE